MKKILWLVIVVMLSGCVSLSSKANISNVYVNPALSKTKIHDVGLLPFSNESGVIKDIDSAITSGFVTQMNKRGWYVMHNIAQDDLNQTGKLKGIDAVIKASIIEYRDYEPLRLGLRIAMIDLDTNETLWSIQEVFDAAKQETVESVKNYYASNIDNKYPIMGYKLYLISMNKFVEFAINRLVSKIDEQVWNTKQ